MWPVTVKPVNNKFIFAIFRVVLFKPSNPKIFLQEFFSTYNCRLAVSTLLVVSCFCLNISEYCVLFLLSCYSPTPVSGVPFPKNYLSTVKKILSRLYRVFVHVYIHHFDKLVGLGAVSYLRYDVSMCNYTVIFRAETFFEL